MIASWVSAGRLSKEPGPDSCRGAAPALPVGLAREPAPSRGGREAAAGAGVGAGSAAAGAAATGLPAPAERKRPSPPLEPREAPRRWTAARRAASRARPAPSARRSPAGSHRREPFVDRLVGHAARPHPLAHRGAAILGHLEPAAGSGACGARRTLLRARPREDLDRSGVGETVLADHDDPVAPIKAARDLDPVVLFVTEGHVPPVGGPVLDHEDRIGEALQRERPLRHDQRLLPHVGHEPHPGEHSRTEPSLPVHLERDPDRSRGGVHHRADPQDAAPELLVRKRLHLQERRLADGEPGEIPFRHPDHAEQRIEVGDTEELLSRGHRLPELHRPLDDQAVEGRGDAGIAELDLVSGELRLR